MKAKDTVVKTQKWPRYTAHQLNYMLGMRNFEDGVRLTRHGRHEKRCVKSWKNEKGVRVWNFTPSRHLTNVLGDPWDTQTGESLLKKGLIEPWFTVTHDGGHDAPDGNYRYARGEVIQFYRLTALGREICLN